ncbi:MAG TPA: formylglycine-generating enzyme family protein [Armatimonadota bacterium]|jgi:formylglycine-generating enzyme required for sulfatase activity
MVTRRRGYHPVVYAIVVVLLLAGCCVCYAQEAKAWEQAGTQVGQEIIGPDGGTMVWVPPGEFVMGSEDGYDDEKPAHQVRISRGFWLGKYTVTNAQYQRYCREVGVGFLEDSSWGDNHPVFNVNWTEAKAYCEHYGLSLPTEAQWEYAARGPAGLEYPWGDEWDARKCCNLAHRGPQGSTWPVGSFPAGASWCGALDMAGNVFQWCRDWYAADDYYAHSPNTDPPGPDTGTARLLRGGSWHCNADYCRSASRVILDPSDRDFYVGIRGSRTP